MQKYLKKLVGLRLTKTIMNKYSLTTNTKQWCGTTLFQIKAEKSFVFYLLLIQFTDIL